MQLFCVKPKIDAFDTFIEFAEAFSLGKRDMILTEKVVYDAYIAPHSLECRVILRDTYETGEPSENAVDQILGDMRDCAIERVIAVGGGSVIDTAKLLTVQNAYPIGRVVRGEVPAQPDKGLIIVPTTCGTGSEVTFGGIITMRATGLKTAIMDERLTAQHAVLIPQLIEKLPFKLFVHCSLDALSHSMESFVSATRSNPFARAVGAEAIKLILNGYAEMLLHGPERRAEFAKDFITASCLGGMAVNNGGAGPIHALAYPLGEKYKLSHGESIYEFLTAVFTLYMRENPNGSLLCELADIIEKPLKKAGITDGGNVFERLDVMLNKLLPNRRLSECGMTEADIEPFVESVFASKQRLLVASYVPFTRDMAKDIYLARL